jgi:hypothetical protein
MTFNPLESKGMPVEKQLRTIKQLSSEPYDKREVDPYTRCRIIAMNGIEVESIMFSHQFNRHTDILEVREKLAESRRIEQQQQKVINWLIPGDESTLEATIGYEQLAVDLTAWIARMEPNPYLKQVYDFGLLEDFDHLYRYSNLYELLEGKKAEHLVNELTEIMPGRPTTQEHRHPIDDVRRHWDKHTADPISKLHAMTITSAEQQTMNYYMTIGNRFMEPIARGLYAEIGMIEEQHVTQYESMQDPAQSWFEELVMHEYNEVYLYNSFMETESDPRIKKLWEQHLDMELGQLQVACDLMRRYDGREPEEVLPAELPAPLTMEPNKEYVRDVLAAQVDLTFLGTEPVTETHKRFEAYQDAILATDAFSEDVIDLNRKEQGREYRLQTNGEHPVERLRESTSRGSN